jgi:anti-anti-sigma factor
MFNIERAADGSIILTGRLDASRVDAARALLDTVRESSAIDCSGLDYISSAGLGILLGAQRRLMRSGQSLRLVNLKGHVRDLFVIAGFNLVMEIE